MTFSRRKILQLLAATPLAGAVRPVEAQQSITAAPAAAAPAKLQVGLVSRHLQWTTLEDAIDIIAKMGFDAIEWNVRAGGHIEPEHVERDLPRAVELTRKAGLAVTMITTSIQDAKSPYAEPILQAASGLGIRYYRGGQYFRYDYSRDLAQQLEALKPRIATLVALNEKYKTAVCYHTHSAPGNIGGNIWDLWEVIKGFDPQVIGLNDDIGHATARNGNGWADGARIVMPYILALAIKDVQWFRDQKGTWRTEFVPVGEGMIDLKRLFELLKAAQFNGPINIHIEHDNLLGSDLGTWKLDMSREQFMAIITKDLQAVRARMREAQL